MALYRVRPGFVHGLKNEYKAGDTLEIEPRAAAGFADKLELVPVEPAESPVEVVPVVGPAQVFDVTGSTVAAVLAAVQNGLITAEEAYEIEVFNRNRATLVKALVELLNGPTGE